MKIYILAGGEGSRMQPWTSIFPKCLLPVGGKPVSRIIVERLIDEGFTEIILCINRIFEREFKHEYRDIGHAPRPEGRGVKPLRDQEAWK